MERLNNSPGGTEQSGQIHTLQSHCGAQALPLPLSSCLTRRLVLGARAGWVQVSRVGTTRALGGHV